jgi:hypothetical protein
LLSSSTIPASAIGAATNAALGRASSRASGERVSRVAV